MRNAAVRFPVEPRDLPRAKVARLLHLTESEFLEKLPALNARRFPSPDPTTGHYDRKAVEAWMDSRSGLTQGNAARDARQVGAERMARFRGGNGEDTLLRRP